MKTEGGHEVKGYLIASLLLSIFVLSPLSGFSQDVRQTEEKMMRQADQNIEKYRKGDVIIGFVSNDGKPVRNVKIEVKQKSHDFLFGCIIFDMIRNENTYKEELFKARYKKIFNLAVFPFYWPGYESGQGFTPLFRR